MVFEDRTLSYAALDAHANRLAHHLQSLGVGPETMVGLCVERSPEMVVGLLGILKAGGAYLPLDPNYPRERLAFMLADAGCPVLVTQSALLDRLPEGGRGAAGAARRRLARDRAPARHRAAARPRSATTRPMSSTPRARPAHQRVSSSSMASLANKMLALGTTSKWGGLPIGAFHFLLVRCLDRTDATALHWRRRGGRSQRRRA